MKYKPIKLRYTNVSLDAIANKLKHLLNKDGIKEAPKRPCKETTTPCAESN